MQNTWQCVRIGMVIQDLLHVHRSSQTIHHKNMNCISWIAVLLPKLLDYEVHPANLPSLASQFAGSFGLVVGHWQCNYIIVGGGVVGLQIALYSLFTEVRSLYTDSLQRCP